MEISFTLKEIPASVDRSKWPVIPNYTEVQEELEKGLQLLEKYKKAVTDEGQLLAHACTTHIPLHHVRVWLQVCRASLCAPWRRLRTSSTTPTR